MLKNIETHQDKDSKNADKKKSYKKAKSSLKKKLIIDDDEVSHINDFIKHLTHFIPLK